MYMAHIFFIVFHCFLLANQFREQIGSDLFNELFAQKQNLSESVHESLIFELSCVQNAYFGTRNVV